MVLLATVYGLLICWMLFLKIIDWYFPYGSRKHRDIVSQPVDVIVAFRNEAHNLPKLIASFLVSEYPLEKLHLILIDDHSEDDSLITLGNLEKQYPDLKMTVQSLNDAHSGKKAAIRWGLGVSSADWVFFTDADCRLRPKTLDGMLASAGQATKKISFGTVRYSSGSALFGKLVAYENLNSISVTAAFFALGHPIMANAANMLLHRSAISDYVSSLDSPHPGGDDVFFAQQMKGRQAVHVADSEVAVDTDPPVNFYDLFSQRLRWASKTSGYSSWVPKGVALWVFVLSTVQLFCFVALVMLPHLWWLWMTFIAFKWLAEYSYQSRWFAALGSRFDAALSLILSLSFPLFVVLVGLASLTRQPFRWKRRTYRSTSGEYKASTSEFTT